MKKMKNKLIKTWRIEMEEMKKGKEKRKQKVDLCQVSFDFGYPPKKKEKQVQS